MSAKQPFRHDRHTVATFTVPAVFSAHEGGFVYSAMRVIVTDRADERLVQHLLSLVRS